MDPQEQRQKQSELLHPEGISLKDVFFAARQHYPEMEPSDLAVPATPRGYKITESIYVSHWIPSHNPDFLRAFGIQSILCLDGKLKPEWAEALGVKKITSLDIPDGPAFTKHHLLDGVKALEDLVAHHSPVLVCCHAGQSRSPAIAIGYIAIHTHVSVKEAFALVRRERAPEREIKIWPSMQEALRRVVTK